MPPPTTAFLVPTSAELTIELATKRTSSFPGGSRMQCHHGCNRRIRCAGRDGNGDKGAPSSGGQRREGLIDSGVRIDVVGEAATGSEALELVRTQRPTW